MATEEIPTVVDFETALQGIFDRAGKERREYVDVVSGELHRQVGGYPGENHRMPLCCFVMKKMMRHDDEILCQPRKGQGATLRIRFRVPRE